MRASQRRAEFILDLLALHAEACKLGLLTTAHTLGAAALRAVEESTKLAERKAQG